MPTTAVLLPNTAIPAVATDTFVPDTATVPVDTVVPADTATPTVAATPADTATLADSVTPRHTATPGGTTATPGSTNGATIDLVTAKDIGPHFVAVGPTTSFSAKTSAVYAVAQVHHKAKGANVLFTWHYPDGSTSPYLNTAVAPYPGDVTAYAEMYPRGSGTYSVTTSINGHVLGSVTFTVGGSAGGSANSVDDTATPDTGSTSNTRTTDYTVTPAAANTDSNLFDTATPSP